MWVGLCQEEGFVARVLGHVSHHGGEYVTSTIILTTTTITFTTVAMILLTFHHCGQSTL